MSLQTYLDPAGFFHDDTNGRSATQGVLDPLNQDPLGLYEPKGGAPEPTTLNLASTQEQYLDPYNQYPGRDVEETADPLAVYDSIVASGGDFTPENMQAAGEGLHALNSTDHTQQGSILQELLNRYLQ